MVDIRSILRQSLDNPMAEFRLGQEEAIRAILEPPHRALVVQATGWGKSIVYFIATRVLRDQRRGPTIVISPLLSLMRNQIEAAQRLNLSAERYTSDNSDQWSNIEAQLRANKIDLLLISPERLANDEFRSLVSSSSIAKAGLIVIDEAHCISDWGHDFRPDYQRIGDFIRLLPPLTAVIATTATANERVVQDIQAQIGSGIKILRGALARKSLSLQVIAGQNAGSRLAWLSDHLNDLPGSGIIYTLTKRDAERVAQWLTFEGHSVAAYHSQIPNKEDIENRLLKNEIKALIATVALGMGFDKPDLGFVVHYQSPGNLVAYYQQIGRAGRGISQAVAVLFMGAEDERIHEFFINSRSSEEQIRNVLNALDQAQNGLNLKGLTNCLNMKESEIKKVLKTLSVLPQSPVVKINTLYRRTPVDYSYDSKHQSELDNRRFEERKRFVAFAEAQGCLMMLVAKELDDSNAQPCGKCANCLGREIVGSNVLDKTRRRAMNFLKRSEFPIEPRKQWTSDAFPQYGFSGRIADNLRCEQGICLSKLGDPEIAEWVRKDKDEGHFRDELVQAAIEAIRRSANLPNLEWVCAVPSLRSGSLVPDFAVRLASALNLEYVDAVEKVRATDQQKLQQNSSYQSRNLDGAFGVKQVRNGAVLLVDDMVDSRWTFTVIGALLRQSTSGPVIPFALCSTSNGDADD